MFDVLLKRFFDFAKLMAIVTPTALSVAGFVYRDIVLKSVADQMYPSIYKDLKEDLPSIISEVIRNDERTAVKLDSNQMLQIERIVLKSKNQTLKALPIMMMQYAEVAKNQILTQTYPVHDFYTGRFLYEETGIKTDSTWIILQKR